MPEEKQHREWICPKCGYEVTTPIPILQASHQTEPGSAVSETHQLVPKKGK